MRKSGKYGIISRFWIFFYMLTVCGNRLVKDADKYVKIMAVDKADKCWKLNDGIADKIWKFMRCTCGKVCGLCGKVTGFF